jgi:hypothetical protein
MHQDFTKQNVIIDEMVELVEKIKNGEIVVPVIPLRTTLTPKQLEALRQRAERDYFWRNMHWPCLVNDKLAQHGSDLE